MQKQKQTRILDLKMQTQINPILLVLNKEIAGNMNASVASQKTTKMLRKVFERIKKSKCAKSL